MTIMAFLAYLIEQGVTAHMIASPNDQGAKVSTGAVHHHQCFLNQT
jgi:hypothetical protein